ncbi:50S ribosomal protein L3 [Candidatus Kuenenbacteria bacterium RIFCSPHIGHO2_02_FULL_39_13]|uniref:Large ribosomal subunit protein uL3 n=1 Tax=Candidatus Kuenenbacteria bacterium RIFCSPHIGHO2_02_FULL_39_13 TaxID=1798561 RepID=A0A1F6FNW2_9BACT|nr:MAG: 50S ribosomal protein L3 [Candidatus Kuenenbacteria bacterium RIFCSPHIGHO2_02_FULL_39_13]
MKFILGTKKQMTQIFEPESGDVIPVTIVNAGPCRIVKIKTSASKDGYNAIVLGLPAKKKLAKRELGQIKDLGNLADVKEFRSDELKNLKRGDALTVDIFEVGDKVKVVGISKGKGFQGVVKRYGFHGHSATHGTKDQERSPGSIGPTAPARVFPGMRMAGHMGAERVTVKNLAIAKIDSEKNELYIKGALPGAKNGLLLISCPGALKVKKS